MKGYALVTGASRGIGKAIAYTLAKEGYHLYLTGYHSYENLQILKNELEEKYQISCSIFKADISCYDDVAQIFGQIKELDLLINNAGISYIGLLSEMSISDWHKVIDTNLSSVFYTSKLAIPFMLRKRCGKIINISSVWGNVGASTEVAYSSSKGGLNSFTKALAKELAPNNIQVNAIACGVIDTQMNQDFSLSEMRALIDEIPADRLGKVDEVADLVLQLIQSPAYLTGQIIGLDGGWT
ncbi:MAG TPA: SDR family NAD(P)-dependent oxidoreductase [Lachnospiraceae bacterium]|nr:SDR family NAD(P)-dependent oxidoreductase [Lachnospiraceae bacterium]